jgi:hypothetical protein
MIPGYVWALGFLCLGMPLAAQSAPAEPAATRLLSQDGAVIHEAKTELLAARAKLIADLSAIIRDHENQLWRRASVHAAILILGEMRAPEAAEVLASYIAFPQQLPPAGRRPVVISAGSTTHWPAAEALIKIGMPCVPALLDKLAQTDNTDEGEACLAVLHALRERDSVWELLEKAIARETDAGRRFRLEAGLALLSEGKVTPLGDLGPHPLRPERWPPPAPPGRPARAAEEP